MLLLHYDACATVINGTAQIPKDVTQNAEIRSMLEGERDYLSSKSYHGNSMFSINSHVDCFHVYSCELFTSCLFSRESHHVTDASG